MSLPLPPPFPSDMFLRMLGLCFGLFNMKKTAMEKFLFQYFCSFFYAGIHTNMDLCHLSYPQIPNFCLTFL